MRILIVPFVLLAAGCAVPDLSGGAADPIVIRNVTLIDGTGAPPRGAMSVVVEAGRIATVGPAADVAAPDGATVIDGAGRYLIPGLWDLHVHLSKSGGHLLPLFVANGVTGIRDTGGDAALVSGLRAAVADSGRHGPRIVMAGPIVESGAYMRRAETRDIVEPVERFRVGIDAPARARAVVDSIAALGADFIKIRTTDSLATYHAIAAAARAVGLPLAGHAQNIPAEDVLRSGQRSVEHFLFPFLTLRDSVEADSLARELARAGTAFVPTLAAFTRSIFVPASELSAMLADTSGEAGTERRYMAGFAIDDWEEQLDERVRYEAVGDTVPWGEFHAAQLADMRLLHSAGAAILAGTDIAVVGVFPGSSLHEELYNLVALVGLTPMEAIEAATRRAAQLVGLADRTGTIAAGMAADLVLLDADPLADIRNTRRIVAVIRQGELFDGDGLAALRAEVEAEADRIRNDGG